MSWVGEVERPVQETGLKMSSKFSQPVDAVRRAYLHHALDIWTSWNSDIRIPVVDEVLGPLGILSRA